MSGKFLVILATATFIGATQAAPAELAAVLLEYRDVCTAVSGSDEGYQQVLGSIQPAKTCLLNRLDVQQLQKDAPAQLDSGSWKLFFNKYCPKLKESMSCFDDTLEGVAKCVGNDVDQVKALIKTVTYNLLDLMCQNDGQLFIEALKPEFKECVTKLKEHGTQECNVSDSLKKAPFLRYGEQQCSELSGVQECFKKKVDECGTPKLFDMFQVVFNAMFKANNCNQYTTLGETFNNKWNHI